MINLLRHVFSSKLRLYFEYALLATILGSGAAAVTLYYQRSLLKKDVAAMKVEVEQVAGVNERQQATIDALAEQRVKDAKVVVQLLRTLDTLSKTSKGAKKHLQDLEKNNETVRDYLNAPVPLQLACVLVGACADSNRDARYQGSAAGSLADSLLPPSSRHPPHER